MRVSEQLDHHAVEPNPLPAAAGTLHALAQVWIVLRSRKPREQSDAERQRHHERRCGVDGERRSLVNVVKARDDAIRPESFLNIGTCHSRFSCRSATPFSRFHTVSQVSCSRNSLEKLKSRLKISYSATAGGERGKSTLDGSSLFPSGRKQSIETATPKICVLRFIGKGATTHSTEKLKMVQS